MKLAFTCAVLALLAPAAFAQTRDAYTYGVCAAKCADLGLMTPAWRTCLDRCNPLAMRLDAADEAELSSFAPPRFPERRPDFAPHERDAAARCLASCALEAPDRASAAMCAGACLELPRPAPAPRAAPTSFAAQQSQQCQYCTYHCMLKKTRPDMFGCISYCGSVCY